MRSKLIGIKGAEALRKRLILVSQRTGQRVELGHKDLPPLRRQLQNSSLET